MNAELQKDVELLKQSIQSSIDDTLRHLIQEGLPIDVETIRQEILQYIFRNESSEIRDDNRHDWYYSYMGQATAIAQGWRQNYAAGIKNIKDCQSSIKEYIRVTYGDA